MESRVFLADSQNSRFYEEYCKPNKKTDSQVQNTFADAVSRADYLQQNFNEDINDHGKQSIRQYRERVFDQIAANAPASVKKAWLDAADAVGTDGMGVSDSGKLDHISQLMVRRIERGYRGESTSNLLGNSVQSAIRVANESLDALERSMKFNHGKTAEQIKNQEKEKLFYQEFIRRLL